MTRASRLIKTLFEGLSLFAFAVAFSLAGAVEAGAQAINSGEIFVIDQAFEAGRTVARILRIDSVTGAQTVVTAFSNSRLDSIAVDRDVIFVAGLLSPVFQIQILRVDPTTGAYTVLSSGGCLDFTVGLAIEPSGNLIVVDSPGGDPGDVIRIDRDTGAQSIVTAGQFIREVIDVAIEAGGNILLADSFGKVIRIDPVTGAQALVTSGGHLVSTQSVAVEADGGILVLDFPDQIVRVDPLTGVQTLVTSAGELTSAMDLAVGANGDILVADRGFFVDSVTPDGKVVSVSPLTGAQTILSSGLFDTNGIAVVPTPAATTVAIDVKPGGFPNSINLGSNGTVPVAIFSTATFDALLVDPMTVTLAGAQVKLKGKGTPQSSFEDVNHDGLSDLIVHVSTEALQLTGTDTEAVLEGETVDGMLIRGVDSVRIVP